MLGKPIDAPDETFDIIQSNLNTTVSLNNSRSIKTVFIAQTLNRARLIDATTAYGWLPYDSDVWPLQHRMNLLLKDPAKTLFVDFIYPDIAEFNDLDFADKGCFSDVGARKFLTIISGDLAHQCGYNYMGVRRRMKLQAKKTILICIDIQLAFLEEDSWGGNRNNKNAEEVCGKIIAKWRDIGEDIIHVRHSSSDPQSKLHKDAKGFSFNPLCAPNAGETVVTKSVNSCFIGTNLKNILDEKKCETVVITGLTTDHCVSTTTRMAGNFGYNTFLISDATATFDKVGINGETYDAELIHNSALASLKDEFATIISSDELFKLL